MESTSQKISFKNSGKSVSLSRMTRKCLHDFFSLKAFGTYMQVLDGRELLISATTEGASFLS